MGEALRLSVVVTSRNDDHGGSMLDRFRIFAEALVEQAERHQLRGEIIVVEWNPPRGPRLRDSLKLQKDWDGFPVRYIEVPFEVHRQFSNSGTIPLFQMIAKNVGIRRARGRFVLATNPDLLFSDELIEFLARADLDERVLYRLDRTDVRAEIPVEASLEKKLDWCRQNVLRVHTRWGTLPDLTPRSIARTLWSSAQGTLRQRLQRVLAMLRGPAGRVHTNGCGDFTLLSKSAWADLRGYPEMPIWSMHLDSLLCYVAVAAGYKQRVLEPPAHMYHLEHASSWVTMDLDERLRTFAQRPWIDTWLLQQLHSSMSATGEPIIYNDEDWGLAGLALEEFDTAIAAEAPGGAVARS